jgi:RNA polymerase sigma-70 factor (ECF subfamily)
VADKLIEFAELLPAETESSRAEDDSSLVEGLQQGAEWAYEGLIQRFQQPIFNLVSRLLWDPGDACDVVQEVFLKVFRKIGSFRRESSLRTWVYRIAVNEAHNHCRWSGRHRGHEVGLEGDEEGRGYREALPAHGPSPYDYALDQERRRMVETALAELSPSYRSVVVLRDVEDLSYDEIAAILNLPMGTVKSRILRGREALRRLLEKRLDPGPELQLWPQLVE